MFSTHYWTKSTASRTVWKKIAWLDCLNADDTDENVAFQNDKFCYLGPRFHTGEDLIKRVF